MHATKDESKQGIQSCLGCLSSTCLPFSTQNMASVFPHMSSERETLLSEALVSAQRRNEDSQDKLRAKLATAKQRAAVFGHKVARWQVRAKADALAEVQRLESELRTVTTNRMDLRRKFESVEQRYSQAMDATSKLQGNRLVSSSIHSAAKTFRRANVVLMAPENADECIRQHMRSDLGLQDLPLMLTAGDVCDDCGVQMAVVSNDSMLSCPQCHKLRLLPNMMTTSALHGTDMEASASITKHRLPEWIEMAQAKEFAEPPEDVIATVARFLVQHNMTGLEAFRDVIADERNQNGPFRGVQDALDRLRVRIPDVDLEQRLVAINASTTRTALRGIVAEAKGKADKFRKFYERSAKLASLISGYWPPRMTGQQEEMLRLLYTVAAPEYEKRRKPRQTYWPGGFPFFLKNVCVLMGWDEIAAQFPIPAGSKEGGSRDLLRNEIWSELGWELVSYSGKLPPMKLPDGTTWSLTLEDDENEGQTEEAAEAQKVRKEVESKISIKKRRRVDFELECS